jgi:hypothetical protein
VAKDKIEETAIAVFKGCVSVQRLSNTQKKEKEKERKINKARVVGGLFMPGLGFISVYNLTNYKKRLRKW